MVKLTRIYSCKFYADRYYIEYNFGKAYFNQRLSCLTIDASIAGRYRRYFYVKEARNSYYGEDTIIKNSKKITIEFENIKRLKNKTMYYFYKLINKRNTRKCLNTNTLEQ